MRNFFILLLLTACGQATPSQLSQWLEDSGHVRILCTISMIGDIASQIGGKDAHCITLISEDLDPHSYELVKGDDEKLAAADLVLYNGLGLEHAPSLRYQLESNPKALAVGETIQNQNADRILTVDGLPDPHIWMDISLWAKIVDPIVERLVSLAPDKADNFRKRGAVVKENLALAHEEVRNTLAKVPQNKRFLVSSHDAFNYFCRAYLREPGESQWQKRCQAPEGLAPDGRLSPLDIERIVNHLSEHRIEVIFSESNVSKDSIRKIVDAASSLGLNVRISTTPLYGDAMGSKGSSGDTYIKMISHNAKAIADELMGGDL